MHPSLFGRHLQRYRGAQPACTTQRRDRGHLAAAQKNKSRPLDSGAAEQPIFVARASSPGKVTFRLTLRIKVYLGQPAARELHRQQVKHPRALPNPAAKANSLGT